MDILLKSIESLTFLIAFLGIYWNFNVISTAYMEFTSIYFYFALSLLLHVPINKSTIELDGILPIENVFILEMNPKTFPKEYVGILTSDDQFIKISGEKIRKIIEIRPPSPIDSTGKQELQVMGITIFPDSPKAK